MTDPSGDSFDALRLPSVPLLPRPALVADLRVRLHRQLKLGVPPGYQSMPKAGGLEYETAGNPIGDAVLFMHAGTATAYQPLMTESALADEFRLVRYHRRGYAGSDKFDGDASVAQHVHDAIALLDQLEIERAHIVGHSGSGVIAIQLALDAPDRVRSLVLEEPAIYAVDPRWEAVMRDAVSTPIERHDAGDSRAAIEMWMRSIAPSWRADLTRTVPGGPQQTVEDAAAFFTDAYLVQQWSFDRSGFEPITLPVLYVIAADSPPIVRAVMRRFQEIVPHTESAVIRGSSHMLHTDQPELVAGELGAFFGRHSI